MGPRESVSGAGEAGRGFAVPAPIRKEQRPLLAVETVGQLDDRTTISGVVGSDIDEVGFAREHRSAPQFDDGDSEAHPFLGQIDAAIHQRRPSL